MSREDSWDRFIDALDRAGQAGQMAAVVVPAFRPDLPNGMRFDELTRVDIENLSRFASQIGRRADVICIMWADLRRKPPKRKRSQKAK